MPPGDTPADHARRIHARDPSLGPAAIAREVEHITGRRCSRQQVAAALASDPERQGGRPPAPYVTLRVRVPRALLPYLDARLEDGVYSGRADCLLAAAEAELVPDAEWPAYERARDAQAARSSSGS